MFFSLSLPLSYLIEKEQLLAVLSWGMFPLVQRVAVPATTVIWPQVLVCAEAKPGGILTREWRTAGAVPWPNATQLVSNCHPDCF